jgi:parallel beta-helix repeat protein
MSGGEISGNIARDGSFASAGGVYAYGSGIVFTMLDGKIYGNKSKTGGGGLYVVFGARFTMKGGEIYGNETNIVEWGNNSQRNEYGGGGVMLYQTVFEMEGGKIYSNIARQGGGVMVYDTTFNMTKGEITGNSASNNGGGVYLYGGTLTGNPQISGTNPGTGKGWIHGNTATQNPATNDVGSP